MIYGRGIGVLETGDDHVFPFVIFSYEFFFTLPETSRDCILHFICATSALTFCAISTHTLFFWASLYLWVVSHGTWRSFVFVMEVNTVTSVHAEHIRSLCASFKYIKRQFCGHNVYCTLFLSFFFCNI